mmetsp:Transcript_19105/g.58820  ORF Transcript_19105/g.58820 Transcript_19105/m.58820 type:complete len:380 (-) Transcript_19105:42-1181(-)
MLRSIACHAPSPSALGDAFAKALAAAGKPDSLLWLTDSRDAGPIAAAAAAACGSAAVGARTSGGLIGGGAEHYGPSMREPRVVALALHGAATPFHSPPEGLPDLPAEDWAKLAGATPDAAPPLLLLAAPPRGAGFDLERWLSRMDAALPWSTKVGGVATESDLYLGAAALDGGVVGLALHDVALDAVVGQGAAPVGPAFRVTSVEGNAIRSLDGVDVGAALDPVLKDYDPAVGDLMVGISVPTRPAADGPAAADEAHPYVVRRLIGMHRESSALVVGAAPDLFAAEDVRIQLHAFGPQHARRELSEAAARLQGGAGGVLVPCVGRGPALYGETDVESGLLKESLGTELELAGFFANGEIGPVGARTFVHTFSTVVGMVR